MFESRAQTLIKSKFYFLARKHFTIEDRRISYLKFSTFCGRLTDLKFLLGLLLVSFIWLEEKSSLKY